MTNSEERGWSLFGVTIKKEIDLASLVGLASSATILAYGIYWLTRGPEITIFPPRQVILFFSDFAHDKSAARLIVDFTYINVAPTGNDALIEYEAAQLQIDQQLYEQRWENIVNVDIRSGNREYCPHADKMKAMVSMRPNSGEVGLEYSSFSDKSIEMYGCGNLFGPVLHIKHGEKPSRLLISGGVASHFSLLRSSKADCNGERESLNCDWVDLVFRRDIESSCVPSKEDCRPFSEFIMGSEIMKLKLLVKLYNGGTFSLNCDLSLDQASKIMLTKHGWQDFRLEDYSINNMVKENCFLTSGN